MLLLNIMFALSYHKGRSVQFHKAWLWIIIKSTFFIILGEVNKSVGKL